MVLKKGVDVSPARGKLGILTPGMGAVSTTFMAGVMAVRRGLAKPIGSLTQMGTIRLGKRTDNRVPAIKDYVSLAGLDDLVFGGWDIFPDNAFEAATRAGVLEEKLLLQLKDELAAIKPMPAVFEQAWVKKLNGPNLKNGTSKMDLAEQVMEDIRRFKDDQRLRPPGRGLVRLDRGLPQADRDPRHPGRLRGRPPRLVRRHLPVADLLLRVSQDGRPLRQRRAQPLGRHRRPSTSSPRSRACPSPARTSRPARP